jgi:16S rRNA G966 N2-methylase RsmD
VPFIEASTEPDGLVADIFSGSGMTGVAALLCGRRALLSDLGSGAVHLSRNHTRWVDPQRLLNVVSRFDRDWMEALEQSLYAATTEDGTSGVVRHTIWSEVVECAGCSAEIVLWDAADPGRPLPRWVECPTCGAEAERSTQPTTVSVPAQIVVSPAAGGKLVTGRPSGETKSALAGLRKRRLRYWVPDDKIDPSREMYIRSALQLRGIETVADFFAHRPKLALSRLWHALGCVEEQDVREALQFAFTNTAWHASRMRRYNAYGGQRPLTGTLFIPQLVSEPNVFEVFRHQVAQLIRFYDKLPQTKDAVTVRRSDATDLAWLASGSVDYVFTDPPFGNNIHYADCNIVWEAWLGDLTDNDREIVVNKSRRTEQGGKTVDDYESLLGEAFKEARRVVAADGRVSIVFHNSDDAVWSALLAAVESADLHQAEVSILDKGQRSQKGYKIRRGELVPFYDLVMTFSPTERGIPALNGAGELALDAVREHLRQVGPSDPPAFRSVDFLYSVAVAGVVRAGKKPVGLSLRAFEQLCNEQLEIRGPGRQLGANCHGAAGPAGPALHPWLP